MTVKITVYGIVQGVGFRPFILRTANELNISGYVKNLGSHVEIMAQAERGALDELIRRLDFNGQNKTLPDGCVIYSLASEEAETEINYKKFSIIESSFTKKTLPAVSPDLPLCRHCEEELFDRNNRRYLHPFISCTSCGPRFSIIEKLPYDRERITMKDFRMCSHCEAEYNNPESIRCHAQTIACRDCGPVLKFVCRDGRTEILPPDTDNIPADELKSMDKELLKAVIALNNGMIVAVKDIGGYHFACRADMEETVLRLRRLKGREKKPFAVMFPSVDYISRYAEIDNTEKKFLESDARPIVLLKRKDTAGTAPSVCADSSDIGAFLPCNPVQIMLMRYCGPLVMTSGNISGGSVITENSAMLKLYEEYEELDAVLMNDRRILTPLDDSVVRITGGKPQFIRRARGYVPLSLFWNRNCRFSDRKEEKILAFGGDLKAAFCIADSSQAVMSQYFGDLENLWCHEAWENAIGRMRELYNAENFIYACDFHPGYYSTATARKINKACREEKDENGIVYVQHHHAHIASVIAEHGLEGKVLGFSFDGTGYGPDGNVWGGEVLLCEEDRYERVRHLEYIKLCGGDEAAKNAALSMCCYLNASGIIQETQGYRLAAAALDCDINTFMTSSMGRLFDAVSAILGIKEYNEYEGQCAILLEKEADSAIRSNIAPLKLELKCRGNVYNVPDLIRDIYEAVQKGVDKRKIALGFHIAVADAVRETAKEVKLKHSDCRVAALSGGVFANRILLSLCRERLLREGFMVYTNETVPVNDGGIALGQAYIAAVKKYKNSNTVNKELI